MPSYISSNLASLIRFTVHAGWYVFLCFIMVDNAWASCAESQIAASFTALDLQDIKVGGEIGRRIGITAENNLLKLNVNDDFLQPFQERRFEECFIGLGNLIDSLVRFAVVTNDDRIASLKDFVIAEILKAQEEDGYIGTFIAKRRFAALWDIAEMAYIILGLTSDYHYFHRQSSLDAAVKLADYIIEQWPANLERLNLLNPFTLDMATVGLEESLLQLYVNTREKRHWDFCTNVLRLPEWNADIVVGRYSPVEGHAYTYLHKCLAQLRLHRRQPDPSLLQPTKKLIHFLTEQDGLVITGASGQHECWHNNQDGTSCLGETCATAYLIRLLDELIRTEGDFRYGDIMERAIYNSLFAAQSPDGRRVRYYTPFEGPREYYKYDDYCCPGNYRRIIADLPLMIYYPTEEGAAINLFTESECEMELSDDLLLQIRQTTHYPHSGNVTILVNPSKPAVFSLALRIPRWCESAIVTVNDETQADSYPGGSSCTLMRQWREGDRIELQMPMHWRLIKGRKAQAGKVAVMRGPLLYGLNPAYNKNMNAIDLRAITIDPASIRGPMIDENNGIDGLTCMVRGWEKIGNTTGEYPDRLFFLTEFTDPGCEIIYFNVHRMEAEGVDDELIPSLNQHTTANHTANLRFHAAAP